MTTSRDPLSQCDSGLVIQCTCFLGTTGTVDQTEIEIEIEKARAAVEAQHKQKKAAVTKVTVEKEVVRQSCVTESVEHYETKPPPPPYEKRMGYSKKRFVM